MTTKNSFILILSCHEYNQQVECNGKIDLNHFRNYSYRGAYSSEGPSTENKVFFILRGHLYSTAIYDTPIHSLGPLWYG